MRKLSNKTSGIEYQKRIDRALTFIRGNLDRPISLSDVANAACFSEFHFHRIFSSLMHETVGEYITRKKLEHAAMRLAYSPSTSVSVVADECGYASVSSFSKSFNQWFGCRPTDIQQIKQRLDSGGGKLQTKYEKSIEANELFVTSGEDEDLFSALDEHVNIKSIDAFDVVYLTSEGGYEIESIRNTWVKLFQLVEDAGVDWSTCERFSLSHDHPGLTPAERCRYDACVRFPMSADSEFGSPLNLPKAHIPAGRYAIFPAEGPEDSILNQYLEFYTGWMPQSGYEPDNFPVLEHLLPTCEIGYIQVELWAKIKPITSIF